MKDDLEQLLTSLHLRKIAEISTRRPSAPRRPTAPTRSSPPACSARSGRPTRKRRWPGASRAGLPEQWTLESFPFKRQPGVNQRQIRTFAELGAGALPWAGAARQGRARAHAALGRYRLPGALSRSFGESKATSPLECCIDSCIPALEMMSCASDDVVTTDEPTHGGEPQRYILFVPLAK